MIKIPVVKKSPLIPGFSIPPQTFVQDWSTSVNHTFKDLKADFVVRNAVNDLVDKLCVITSGNAGISVGRLGLKNMIKVFCIVDSRIDHRIYQKLKRCCTKVIKTDLSAKILHSEDTIRICRENPHETIRDVTNGQSDAYKSILPTDQVFDYIICPVGSGESFCGIYDAIKYRKIKTKLIGVTPEDPNSVADKLVTPWTPYSKKIQSIISKQGNKLIKVSEPKIIDTYLKVNKYIRCEPSSSIVWSVFSQIKFSDKSKILVINTGQGNF